MLRLRNIFIALIVFCYSVSLLTLVVPFAVHNGIFVSPDEHATWTFARAIAETGIANISEERNVFLGEILHPRSALALGASIVPAGFLGITYLAGVFFVVSPFFAACVAPICSIFGLCALYHLVRIFGGSRAFAAWTVVALALHPVWWYYSIRSLMPNVPFVALLLGACSIFFSAMLQRSVRRGCWLALISGAMFAFALAIRPSEWLWIGGLLSAACAYGLLRDGRAFFSTALQRKKQLFFFCCGGIVVALVFGWLHALVYGSPFVTGYTAHQAVWEVGGAGATSDAVPWYRVVFGFLFPFGVHERATLTHVWRYIVALYPWMTVAAMLGGGMWLHTLYKKGALSWRWFYSIPLVLLVLSFGYLVVLYGSWVFFDNPDPTVISLGNSHTRYWLPLFVALAPLTAYAMVRTRVPVLCALGMLVCSAQLVFWGDDGVLHTRSALATFEEKRAIVFEETPEHAIVIVDRADKYLWPDRAVMVPLRSEKTYARIPELLSVSPLYYFSISLKEEDLAHLHDVIFAGTGIVFTPIVTINEETLYEISR